MKIKNLVFLTIAALLVSLQDVNPDETLWEKKSLPFAVTSNEHIQNLHSKINSIDTKIAALEEENQKGDPNPVPATASSIQKGKSLFMQYCSKCHGPQGKGNGPLAQAIPNIADLASSSVQSKSDKQLFDQITNGKPPMPSFQVLSEKNRWNLVNFVRSLKK